MPIPATPPTTKITFVQLRVKVISFIQDRINTNIHAQGSDYLTQNPPQGLGFDEVAVRGFKYGLNDITEPWGGLPLVDKEMKSVAKKRVADLIELVWGKIPDASKIP